MLHYKQKKTILLRFCNNGLAMKTTATGWGAIKMQIRDKRWILVKKVLLIVTNLPSSLSSCSSVTKFNILWRMQIDSKVHWKGPVYSSVLNFIFVVVAANSLIYICNLIKDVVWCGIQFYIFIKDFATNLNKLSWISSYS